MRWNAMSGDIPRVCALADVLMGAALADDDYNEDEYLAVAAQLIKVLGVTRLPDEVMAHMKGFDPKALDLSAAIDGIGLASPRDRLALLKVLGRVVRADDKVLASEVAYVKQVAGILGLTDEQVTAALG